MPVYPSTVSDRTEPLIYPDPTPREWMCLCYHCNACEAAYRRVTGDKSPNWDRVAKTLGCDDCEVFYT